MAYIGSINERIIDTKTEPKPNQNELKTNIRTKPIWTDE